MTIFWFRRDLRLKDNRGLFEAVKHARETGTLLVPVFIFDSDILNSLERDDARVTHIFNVIQDLDKDLRAAGSRLFVYHDKPLAVFKALLAQHKISLVFTNEDYEPYALARDHAIADLLGRDGVSLHLHKDQVIFARDEVTKDDGTPYKVFTPYSRRWLATLKERGVSIVCAEFPADKELAKFVPPTVAPALVDHRNPTLDEIGFSPSSIPIPRLRLDTSLLTKYAEQRDHMALNATSKIGVALRFGTVSVRQAVRLAERHSEIWLKELIWREFFQCILFHFPRTVDEPFDERFKKFPWRESKADLAKWKAGRTGYPVVDAAMRELNETGFMHNRARMVVGSFICKHLLISWKEGERYFAGKLFDFDLAQNVGNWQWVAGCGVDAAPFFRIFNPTLQAKKFDRDQIYVKRWVPEWGTEAYPEPMVDHEHARRRAMIAYTKMKNQRKPK